MRASAFRHRQDSGSPIYLYYNFIFSSSSARLAPPHPDVYVSLPPHVYAHTNNIYLQPKPTPE